MFSRERRIYWTVFTGVTLVISLFAKAVFGVPVTLSLIVFAIWPLLGLLITADDWMVGGWSNPDGQTSFPWIALGLRLALLVGAAGLHFAVQTL